MPTLRRQRCFGFRDVGVGVGSRVDPVRQGQVHSETKRGNELEQGVAPSWQRASRPCSMLEVLVGEEADRMLDTGFATDVNKILEAIPSERRTLFFSATIALEVDRMGNEL